MRLLRTPIGLLIGLDDFLDQPMPNHIAIAEVNETDA
jgi:hypothetical protein